MSKIRALALALIKNSNGEYLFHKAVDSVKNEIFYRPLGGGIEFLEQGSIALKREFQEEIQTDIEVGSLLEVFENIYTYEGSKGHEIVLVYDAKFTDQDNYKKEFTIIEGEDIVGDAVWRSVDAISKEKSKLYPLGIEKLI